MYAFEIKSYCSERHLKFVGEIPSDITAVKALVQQMPVVEYFDAATTKK